MAFRGEIDHAMLVKIYGVAGKRWEIADIVALIEAKEAEKPLARCPYAVDKPSRSTSLIGAI